jgi:hypothetical protein
VSGIYDRLDEQGDFENDLRWALIHALAELEDARRTLGQIDKGIRQCGGNWYQATCYASAMCERALAEPRKDGAMQALADQAQALDMGYKPRKDEEDV